MTFSKYIEDAKTSCQGKKPPQQLQRDYLVSERKLGFFVKVKEDQNFNRRNTLRILRIKIFI